MNKFKIGDTVRRINTSNGGNVPIGSVGVIKMFSKNPKYPNIQEIFAIIEGFPNVLNSEYNLELVKHADMSNEIKNAVNEAIIELRKD